jgi:hypothetical protein
LKGSAAIATTALAAAPAIASARGPIFDLIAEADRLHALATAADARASAAAQSVGRDCSGFGLPPLDTSKPELAEMVLWIKRNTRHPWHPDHGIARDEIEAYAEIAVERYRRNPEAA